MSFQTLGLGPNILRAIEESGYSEPTPIQSAAIPVIIEGNGGDRHCPNRYRQDRSLHPAHVGHAQLKNEGPRERKTRALVISPTRELVVQIHDNAKAYAKHLPLKVATVYGGVGEGPQKQALAKRGRFGHRHPRAVDGSYGSGVLIFRALSSSSSTKPTGCSTWASAQHPPDFQGSAQKGKANPSVFGHTFPGNREIDPRVPVQTANR